MVPETNLLTATEIAAAVQRGSLSATEVVDAHLSRIEDRTAVGAYITVLDERARDAAREIDDAVKHGQLVGPLAGVPIGVKDKGVDVKGVAHTYGNPFFAENISDRNSVFVDRLLDAGAIVVGKTSTPEFAHRAKTENKFVGATSTPFDLSRNAGGSSGGSAAAVADGQAALAHGTDAGGSVRIPSSCCGVYGLKPSFGRIPNDSRPNAFDAQTPNIDSGIHARTVEDAATMLDVVAGPHPSDPCSLPAYDGSYRDACQQPIDDLRIGYSPDLDVFQVSETVQTVVEDAVEAFEEAGATIERVEVDFGRSWEELIDGSRRPAMQVLAAAFTEYLAEKHGLDLFGEHREQFTETYRARVKAGQEFDAITYKRSDEVRTLIFDEFMRLFGEYDVLLAPTLGTVPFPNDQAGPTEIDGHPINPLSEWFLTWPVNATGQPAATVPAGFTDDGLPVGMQVIGDRHADDDVLAASAAFERARPWYESYRNVDG